MEDIIKRTNARLEHVRKKKEERLEEQTWKKHAHRYQPLDGMTETVRYLVQEVMGTGRNITLDRLYTSVPLAEELQG
ncbi:hypothetical protein FJT64_018704 [Amphibalanus amphitrite]|uniref:PiggyBac transposable element-derived protein domain-containing protein n=1 Tax=Amphibalanus amphitrite TaxID=1232801 RepID=A0A6A4WSV1_AMPAM|nr:hypothetical protein FJT64_018704 [Amphibalanus amphitrite]